MRRLTKGFLVIFLFMILVALVGCNNNADSNNMSGYSTVMETKGIENDELIIGKYPFPKGVGSIGRGEIIVNTPAGTTADGRPPVIYVDEDDQRIQVGIYARNFDGRRQSFVYVDKIYLRPEQFVDRKDTSIGLQGAMLNPGTHIISFIQFENDDPINGRVTSYSEAKYAIARKIRNDQY